MKQPKIKSMKYEDFKDNEYLEQLRANGTDIIVGCLDDLINWGRSNSVWPLTFATSCCGIEFMAVGAARYDFARLKQRFRTGRTTGNIDIYRCPPRPESLLYGMMQLQRKIKVEKFLGGANKQQDPRNSNDEATPQCNPNNL